MRRQFLLMSVGATIILAAGIYVSLGSWKTWVLLSPLRASVILADGAPTSSSEAGPRRKVELPGRSVVISRAEADFGLVPVGERSQEISFTVTNGGSVPLELRAIQSRTGAFLMTRGPNLPARIGSGVRVTISLIFSPREPGSLNDVVEIYTGAGDEPVVIPVRGQALDSAVQMAAKPRGQERGGRYVARGVHRTEEGDVEVSAGDSDNSKVSDIPTETLPMPAAVVTWPPATDTPLPSWLNSEALGVPYVRLAVQRIKGSGDQSVRCEWEVVNPTGRPLTYSLFYEETGERVLLVSGLRGQSTDLSLASGAGGRIIVQATDGSFTSEDSVILASSETHTGGTAPGPRLRD